MLLAAEAVRQAPRRQASDDALATALTTNPDLVGFVGDTATPREGGGASETAGDWPARTTTSGLLGHARLGGGDDPHRRRGLGRGATPAPHPRGRRRRSPREHGLDHDDLLLLIGSRSVVGIDGTTGEVRLPRTDGAGQIDDAAVSADGEHVAFISSTNPDRATVTVLPLTADGRAVRGDVPCCPLTTALGSGQTDKHLTGTVAWRGDDLRRSAGTGPSSGGDSGHGRAAGHRGP